MRAEGERRESLSANTPSRSLVDVWNHQGHDTNQHWVRYVVGLSDPNPLRCIAELSGRNLKQVASRYGDHSHAHVLAFVKFILARPI
jgi:hypothetical protein